MSERRCDGKGKIMIEGGGSMFISCSGCDACNPPERAPEPEENPVDLGQVMYQALCGSIAGYQSKGTKKVYREAAQAVAAHVRQQQAAKIERQNILIKVHYDLLRERDAEIERLRAQLDTAVTALAHYSTRHATLCNTADEALLEIGGILAPATGDTAPPLESRVAQLENELLALKERIGMGSDK